MTIRNICRSCQICAGEQNRPPTPLRTTDLEQWPSTLAAQREPLAALENIDAAWVCAQKCDIIALGEAQTTWG